MDKELTLIKQKFKENITVEIQLWVTNLRAKESSCTCAHAHCLQEVRPELTDHRYFKCHPLPINCSWNRRKHLKDTFLCVELNISGLTAHLLSGGSRLLLILKALSCKKRYNVLSDRSEPEEHSALQAAAPAYSRSSARPSQSRTVLHPQILLRSSGFGDRRKLPVNLYSARLSEVFVQNNRKSQLCLFGYKD